MVQHQCFLLSQLLVAAVVEAVTLLVVVQVAQAVAVQIRTLAQLAVLAQQMKDLQEAKARLTMSQVEEVVLVQSAVMELVVLRLVVLVAQVWQSLFQAVRLLTQVEEVAQVTLMVLEAQVVAVLVEMTLLRLMSLLLLEL